LILRNRAYRLILPFIIILVIIIIGIIGFIIIERFTFVEALYMTIISVTTAGFTEVHPLTGAGRLFTVFLLITSWSSFAFAITRITEFVVGGEINKYFKTRKLMSAIKKMEQHVIVCGFGRNGQQACKTLKSHQVPFVVIEKDQGLLDKFLKEDNELVYLVGDSTDDQLLKEAGIDRARALITALPVDTDNVFIVLSARSLNPKIQIISRASDMHSAPKLKIAGADNVIMPDKIGGTHMATLISKPDIIEFIDYLSGEDGASIHMEAVHYDQLPEALKGKTLLEIINWEKTGVICIGIKDHAGKFNINPSDQIIVGPGMKIIVLGTLFQIEQMKKNLG
jgi:voltage-gated potassium channel